MTPTQLRSLEANLATQIKRGEGNAEATVSCNSKLLHDCHALAQWAQTVLAALPPSSP